MKYINYLGYLYISNLLDLISPKDQNTLLEFLPIVEKNKHSKKKFTDKVDKKFFENLIASNENEIGRDCKYYQAILMLQKTFELSDEEVSLMNVSLFLDFRPKVKNLLRELSGSGNRFDDSIHDFSSILLGKEKNEVLKLFNLNSNLIRSGLFHKEKLSDLSLSKKTLEFITNYNGQSYLETFLEKDEVKSTIKLDSFQYKKELSIIASIIRNKPNAKILLSGTPGTGKTTCTRILRDLTEMVSYFIPQSNESGSESVSFRRSTLIALNSSKVKEAIYVVDEAELILNQNDLSINSSTCNKSWINKYLESNELRQIYIVNDSRLISSSTLRRFDYILNFKEINQKTREEIIIQMLYENNLDLKDTYSPALKMISKLNISPADLALGLQSAIMISSSNEEVYSYWLDILKSKSGIYHSRNDRSISLL